MKQISTKAYKDFNKRIFDAFKSINPCFIDGIGIVMGMLSFFLPRKMCCFICVTHKSNWCIRLSCPNLKKRRSVHVKPVKRHNDAEKRRKQE